MHTKQNKFKEALLKKNSFKMRRYTVYVYKIDSFHRFLTNAEYESQWQFDLGCICLSFRSFRIFLPPPFGYVQNFGRSQSSPLLCDLNLRDSYWTNFFISGIFQPFVLSSLLSQFWASENFQLSTSIFKNLFFFTENQVTNHCSQRAFVIWFKGQSTSQTLENLV